MIDFVSYDQMLEWWQSPNEKIKCVIFYKVDCPYCDDFIPHILEPALQESLDHFDIKKVCVDTGNVPFPPQSTPMVYFEIPNTTEKMPLIRSGGATPETVRDDLNCMIDMKVNNKTINQAFFENKPAVMSAWAQRRFF